jgi:hypothetical protein
VSTLLFAVPVYFMIGLKNQASNYLTFLVICIVHALTSSFLGITISSGASNVRVAQVIGPLVVVTFLIFGGQLVSLDTVTAVLRWLKWLSVIYYAYTALAQNEFVGLQFECLIPAPDCKMSGEVLLERFNLDDLPNVWDPVLYNAIIGIGCAILGYVLFLWQSRPLKKLS